jgi:hypothetical protein
LGECFLAQKYGELSSSSFISPQKYIIEVEIKPESVIITFKSKERSVCCEAIFDEKRNKYTIVKNTETKKTYEADHFFNSYDVILEEAKSLRFSSISENNRDIKIIRHSKDDEK